MQKRETYQTAAGRDMREAIAVVGMGCRFPGGVNNPEQFWELLRRGQDAIIEVPPERWGLDDYYDPDRESNGKMVTRFGGFIDGMDQFDPEFFGISPNEAERMDPQQRQLLEVAWEALEDGGHVPAKLRGTDVGVFIGAFSLDYHALQFGDPFQRSVSTYTAAGSMATMLSNRISYIYDFRGPSMTIDTACSSSLVSLHLACESLRSGESSMALAGGVVLTFAPQYTVVESAGGFLSPEGRCKTFDASASGYVRGEGVGVVALKRLTDAMEAGDPIQAVILASSVNQDGHTVGITVPSGDAQAQLIRDTLRKAGVKPTDIRYVEAHGTGTPVGDPIEAGAIGEVYGEGRPASEPLLVGSCKTNIGHTESAAGIAGFMKAVLCLRHRQIPPHLHLQQPNPAIAFDRLRLKLPTAMETWPEHEGPAIAAVNSFGFGGANAHAIVREPLPHERKTTGSAGTWAAALSGAEAAEVQLGVPPAEAGLEAAGADLSRERVYVLPLSARKAEALEQARAAYRQRLTENGGSQPLALEDLCWSAGVRREHHNYRQALVFRSREELDALLKGSGPAGDATQAGFLFSGRKPSGEKPKLVWTFSGMGPQWYGMGRQLLRQEPLFRETMERGDALFAPIAGWSMLAELCKDEADSRMNEAAISMPISFLLQVSLAALWRSWGMTPDLIVGHSAGEVAAFYEAGVYTLEDALRVVYHRSRLLDRMSGTGGMAFVAVSETEVAELLDGLEDKISIAAVNSPTSVTLSGDTEALAEAVKRAEAKGMFTRILRVQVPFHSRYLEPIKEELIDCLKHVPSGPASVPLYSSVTASEIRGEEIDGAYWWRNVRETVAYASAIDQLIRQGYTNYLEIGAHPVLSGALAECLGDNPGLVVASIRRKEDEPEAMMRGLAELYTAGFEPDWQAIYRQGRWITLPAYPWQKKRYWHEPEFIRHIRHGHKDHPLLGRPLPGAMKAWETEISLRRLPYLRDHRVLEQVLYPAAAYIEGAMAMLSQALSPGEGSFVLEQLELHRGLTLSANQPSAVMQHVLDVENGTFRIFSAQDEQRSAFVLHASGRVRQLQRRPGEAVVDISAARQATPLVIDQAKAYRILKHAGFEYGPTFQGIKRVHLGDDEAWVEVELPLEEAVTREYGFHPSLLDACFQALLAAEFPAEGEQPRDFGHEFRIPVRIGSICFYARPDGRLWAHSRMIERNNSFTRGNLRVYNDRGMLVAEFLDFVKQSVDAATSRMDELQARRWLNRLEWREAELPAAAPGTAAVALDSRMSGTWLMLADARGIAEEAAALLRRAGGRCLLAVAGDEYAFGGEAQASLINPADPGHYDRLLADAVQEAGGALSGVAHVWNVDLPAPAELAGRPLGGEWERIKSLGTHSLLYLAQSLARTGADTGVWIVTQGAQSVPEAECSLAVFQAGAWGLGRYIGQQEMRQYGKGLIDVDPRASAAEAALCLVDEMTAGDAENQIAYRDHRRYALRLKRDSETPSSLPLQCRADGAYIVTGAFGAIGQEVARLLVRKGARHLLLLGRSALPERTKWDLAIADSREGERIAFVRELEAAGAHVSVVGVDMTDEAEMSGFIQRYEASGSLPIRGVVHSAGAVKDVLLMQMDDRIFDEAYDPKAKGAWLLHQAMLGQPLEFFVLFSSLGSLLPAAGQGNYAAGNAYLDALAAYRRSLGLPALSINWGPWSVGMVKKLQLADIFETNGIDIITPAIGMRLFEHLIGQNVTQIVALSAGWRAFRKLYDDIPLLELLEEEESDYYGASASGELAIETIKMLAPHERELAVRRHVEAIIADLLHFAADAVDATKALPEIGLDSMMAIRLRARLLNELGVAPMVGELLSGNSIMALSDKMVRQFDEQHQLAKEYCSAG